MGRGVPQNYAEATKWYRAAAELRYPYAASALGSLYMKMQHSFQHVCGSTLEVRLFVMSLPGS
jgi:TPR repeat protein